MTEFSVLIVDDDIWMQRILAKTMESYGFKRTLLAGDGFEGIALAVEHTPLIIIMDIMMPELSGLLALKILKRIKSTKKIPILMVSALSDTENLTMAVKYGTAGFISKPFTKATVYDKLTTIFGKEKLEQIARGEDVQFDSDSFTSIGMEDLKAQFNFFDEFTPSPSSADAAESVSTDKSAPPPKPNPIAAEAVQFYQEDEKRSIESIKKMLLKNKK